VDKKWPRRSGHDFEKLEFRAGNLTEQESVTDAINECHDSVLVFSVPSVDHPEDCQEGFLKMLDEIEHKKIMLHFDHSVKALHMNANLEQVVGQMDAIMAHSETGVLGKWMKKKHIQVPFKPMVLGFDYDAHRARFWKPYPDPVWKMGWGTVRWIGRTARWKGVQLMLDFHEQKLQPAGTYRTILEGLEASINYVIALYYDEHGKTQKRPVNNKFRAWGPGTKKDTEIHWGEEEFGADAYLYPPYKHDDCMERLSQSMFGSDLYHLKADQYGDNIENCHAEIVASGAVPIFHKHFGDNIVHRVSGLPASQDPRSGTIWLDVDNMDQAFHDMEQLLADPGLWNERREMAFEFWKAHSNVNISVDTILECVRTTEKNAGSLEGLWT